MSLTVNLYYTGKNGSARKFAEEMESSGVADRIRKEPGNEKYEYFIPLDDPETILLKSFLPEMTPPEVPRIRRNRQTNILPRQYPSPVLYCDIVSFPFRPESAYQ